MPYPTVYDSYTAVSGTTLEAIADHANMHNSAGSAFVAIEAVIGTTPGTNLARNITNASDLLVAANVGGTLQQAIYGTLRNGVLGTPSVTAGTFAGSINVTGTLQNGNHNGATLGTPTIGTITIPGTVNALGFSAAIAPGVGTLTDSAGGTLIVNAQQGQVFYCAMGTAAGNRTLGTPNNPTGYQLLTYAFKTSGSANGTLIWSTPFRISQDIGTPSLGTGVSWHYFSWRYNQIDSKWDFQGNILNLV